MARPLPSIDAVVARVKALAQESSMKTASATQPELTTDVAKSLQKVASDLRAEASLRVTVQDVLDFAAKVNQ